MLLNSYVYAANAYLPSTVVKSEDLMDALKSETRLGIPRDAINKNMGINERRFVNESEKRHSKLATMAAENLISNNNIDVHDIDCLIYCGIEGDYVEPSTAHIVQSNLGLRGYCFDLANACHGFADGIIIANALVKTGYNNVLLVTAEIPSYLAEHTVDSINSDPSKFKHLWGMLTVGDAAAAMLISSEPGALGLEISQINTLCLSSEYGLCYYHFPDNKYEAKMVMDKICAKCIGGHRKIYDEAKNNTDWIGPEYVFAHQVGKHPHQKIANIFNLPLSRLSKTYDKLGNIISATVPVNIYNFSQKCDTHEHENYLICTSGSGIALSQISLKRH